MTIHFFPGNDPEPEPKPEPTPDIFTTLAQSALIATTTTLGDDVTVGGALAALADMPLKDVIDALFPPPKST